MEMEGLINVKSDVQREIKLLAGVFDQQNETHLHRSWVDTLRLTLSPL